MSSNRNFPQRNKSYFFIKAVVFHHFVLSWMIATKENIDFAVDGKYVYWCIEGLWFNETIFRILMVLYLSDSLSHHVKIYMI